MGLAARRAVRSVTEPRVHLTCTQTRARWAQVPARSSSYRLSSLPPPRGPCKDKGGVSSTSFSVPSRVWAPGNCQKIREEGEGAG